MTTSTFWHDEDKVERLKQMVADSMTASQISAVLGCSRNAVISKLRRGSFRSLNSPRRKSKVLVKTVKAWKARAQNLPPPLPPQPPPPIQPPLMCSFWELTNDMCRWPIGEVRNPGFGFCGLDKDPRGLWYCNSYCSAHTAMALARRP